MIIKAQLIDPVRSLVLPVVRPNRNIMINAAANDEHQLERASTTSSTLAVDSEFTQPRVSYGDDSYQCPHRQHAAPIQGLRDSEGACCCPTHLPPSVCILL
jgi:hypothetical protein